MQVGIPETVIVPAPRKISQRRHARADETAPGLQRAEDLAEAMLVRVPLVVASATFPHLAPVGSRLCYRCAALGLRRTTLRTGNRVGTAVVLAHGPVWQPPVGHPAT